MKYSIGIICLMIACIQTNVSVAQSSENFDEITLAPNSYSQSTTNPRIFGNWSLGIIDSDGNYTDFNHNFLDVTNKPLAEGGTELANGTTDNALHVAGYNNVGKTFIMKSTDAIPTHFSLASFEIDGNNQSLIAEGWSNGVQVVSQTFSTINLVPVLVSLTDNKWQNIDEFRIEQADGSADILFFLDDIEISSALPVTLAHFQATAQSSGIQLGWQMGLANAFKSFTIQRSLDGKNFMDIATIPVNTIPNQNSYQYLDQNAAVGLNYYRIRLISNRDGSNDYSQIITVQSSHSTQNWSISPNPVRSQLTITAPAPQKASITVDIINSGGIKIQTKQLSGGRRSWQLSLPSIANGLYYLSIHGESGHITTLKLIKQ